MRTWTVLGQNFASLAHGTYPMFYISYKKSISRKSPVLPIEKFPSVVLHVLEEWDMVTTPIIQFPLYCL